MVFRVSVGVVPAGKQSWTSLPRVPSIDSYRLIETIYNLSILLAPINNAFCWKIFTSHGRGVSTIHDNLVVGTPSTWEDFPPIAQRAGWSETTMTTLIAPWKNTAVRLL